MYRVIPKILSFVGAAVFTFFGLVTFLAYSDWVPRTCTVSGCPSAYSIEVIYSYLFVGIMFSYLHGCHVVLIDILSLVAVLVGVRLTSEARTRDRILPVLAGVVIVAVFFFVIAYVPLGITPTKTTATTTISSTTVSNTTRT